MSKFIEGYPKGVTATRADDGTMTFEFTCDVCHQHKTHTGPLTTGYGIGTKDYGPFDGAIVCFECCANTDRRHMLNKGAISWLYLTKGERGKWEVINWPGTLRFPVAVKWETRHNWYGVTQTYVRFIGPDGAVWTGRNVGDNELCNCKRTKIDPANIRY